MVDTLERPTVNLRDTMPFEIGVRVIDLGGTSEPEQPPPTIEQLARMAKDLATIDADLTIHGKQ